MILLAIVAVALLAFAVRLVMPVGREILWLQLGYFPSYIVLFAAGGAAAPHHLIERVTLREARPWLALARLALATLPLMVATPGATGVFEGGMNFNALYYAIWEPRVATGVILGLFAGASRARHAAEPATTWLAAGAFGAFILHPPVVVASAILAATWTAAQWVKFLTDDSTGLQSTVHVTQEQAAAIIAMAPGDTVLLHDGEAQHLGDVDDRDLLIAFISPDPGLRPSARRSTLVALLRAIVAGHGLR